MNELILHCSLVPWFSCRAVCRALSLHDTLTMGIPSLSPTAREIGWAMHGATQNVVGSVLSCAVQASSRNEECRLVTLRTASNRSCGRNGLAFWFLWRWLKLNNETDWHTQLIWILDWFAFNFLSASWYNTSYRCDTKSQQTVQLARQFFT